MSEISEVDIYMFGKGTHYEIYNKLGAHATKKDGVTGTFFAVWAPFAKQVSVVGDFNEWNGEKNIMTFIPDSGIWELFVPEIHEGSLYKYAVTQISGEKIFKSDPYAFYAEIRPKTASRVANIEDFEWTDKKWINKKNKEDYLKRPMLIYEVHLGSWKKTLVNYKEIAHELCVYIKQMKYTHVEIIGLCEHPYDPSWGYQVTGYYAPTSRFGTPKDFMYFVDYMHKNNIGVIVDWVPAHFPKDEHGLADFDGTPLYEYADSRGEQKEWGTKSFDLGKNQVSNFLIANALFWIEKYHIDSLRVDAVASMLYLDYGRDNKGWKPNKHGDNRNLEAMEFFKHLNSVVVKRNPRAYLIAEESTTWPGMTKKVEDGGLGFGFKWNMGWMNDFLDYQKTDPLYRKGNHNKMTFSLMYAFSEHFILPISHDEVVHLKSSMIKKMPGVDEDKFKNLKTAYTYMIGHPGKKLLFMGQDFAQWDEWSEDRSLDWHLLDEPLNKDLNKYLSKLFKIYSKEKVLYEYDDRGFNNFQWINADDADRSIFSFLRKGPDSYDGALLFICNFTPVERRDYKVGVSYPGEYTVILNSENEKETGKIYLSDDSECDGFPFSLKIDLKPLESYIFKFPK